MPPVPPGATRPTSMSATLRDGPPGHTAPGHTAHGHSTLRDGPLRYGMASLLNLRPDAVFYGIGSLRECQLFRAKFQAVRFPDTARSRRVRDVLSPFRGRAKYPRPTSAT